MEKIVNLSNLALTDCGQPTGKFQVTLNGAQLEAMRRCMLFLKEVALLEGSNGEFQVTSELVEAINNASEK